MSKTLSYKGTLDMGLEDRINLRTMNGKTGYKITKFQIMSTAPGAQDYEYVAKITKVKDPNIGPVVEFTNSDLMGVAYNKGKNNADEPASTETVIFDNEVTNQNMFVSISDASSGTTPCNYYIELEVMNLSDIQSTELTLRNIRQITSRA